MSNTPPDAFRFVTFDEMSLDPEELPKREVHGYFVIRVFHDDTW